MQPSVQHTRPAVARGSDETRHLEVNSQPTSGYVVSAHRLDPRRQIGKGGNQPVSVLVPTFTRRSGRAGWLDRAGYLPRPEPGPEPRPLSQSAGARSARTTRPRHRCSPRPRPRPPQGTQRLSPGRGDSCCPPGSLREQECVPTPGLLRCRRREWEVFDLLPRPGSRPRLQDLEDLLRGARRHAGSPLQRLKQGASLRVTRQSDVTEWPSH